MTSQNTPNSPEDAGPESIGAENVRAENVGAEYAATDGATRKAPRSQREAMLAGDLYLADDPEIAADALRSAVLTERFNATSAADPEARRAALAELLGELGEGAEIRPPLRVDYGHQIAVGPRTFVNFGAVFLDVARITIGADVQIGPNVQLLTPTHPIDPEPRRAKWEAAEPITIGDNVWLGGGVIVCPGVSIGENTVVGAGAVVTKDLPANVVAVGNPARVIRKIGEGADGKPQAPSA